MADLRCILKFTDDMSIVILNKDMFRFIGTNGGPLPITVVGVRKGILS